MDGLDIHDLTEVNNDYGPRITMWSARGTRTTGRDAS